MTVTLLIVQEKAAQSIKNYICTACTNKKNKRRGKASGKRRETSKDTSVATPKQKKTAARPEPVDSKNESPDLYDVDSSCSDDDIVRSLSRTI